MKDFKVKINHGKPRRISEDNIKEILQNCGLKMSNVLKWFRRGSNCKAFELI